MIGQLAEGAHAPCPTMVLDARELPAGAPEVATALTRVRYELAARGRGDVLKFALLAPSTHPLFDLDYRFVQGLPRAVDAFDFQGSCGHSILASVLVAREWRWVGPLAAGNRVRLRVLNNGDHIVCEVADSLRDSGDFTLHFVQRPDTRLSGLLLTGHGTESLRMAADEYRVSVFSLGNPYVFVDARELGIGSREELFGAGHDVLEELRHIRLAAARRLGLPVSGVFPKVAALGSYTPGRIAARAVSVPAWHPTLALTGIASLAAAANTRGTVPARFHDGGSRVRIDTPGGSALAGVHLTSQDTDPRVLWVSVRDKHARLLTGPIDIDGTGAEPAPVPAVTAEEVGT